MYVNQERSTKKFYHYGELGADNNYWCNNSKEMKDAEIPRCDRTAEETFLNLQIV